MGEPSVDSCECFYLSIIRSHRETSLRIILVTFTRSQINIADITQFSSKARPQKSTRPGNGSASSTDLGRIAVQSDNVESMV